MSIPTPEPAWQTAARELIGLGLREDLGSAGDVTTAALIPADQMAQVKIVARSAGVLCGLPVARMVFDELDPAVRFDERARDGDALAAGQVVAHLSGKLQSLLIGERTCLNFLTHLSGVATLTRRFVDAVAGTRAGIYDTRKTLPGWRALEKLAVAAGGGKNHRMGLYDMVLIKDNHLAGWREGGGTKIAGAVRAARERSPQGLPIEVEVDTLEQLADALEGQPDIVLLDNMTVDDLRRAVAVRDERAPGVKLEASGGVTLASVARIAQTGVERISAGALTHSPPALDLAFDWET
ncbi:MAG: carboxylating nicotinate-nucleotide diphosphorylase [Planctomycetia bacterium]|nr:carboxylating nicotinate-nucleotide diphosphorylase [Planctomycetia bacterium]